jgi:acetaldehyde dehydrogenase (acetylating)
MTLGCGGFGGNITSDNITPRHLLNIKRLAYELRPASTGRASSAPAPDAAVAPASAASPEPPRLPQVPKAAVEQGVSAQAVRAQVTALTGSAAPDSPGSRPVDFVCEEDVRLAIKAGQRIAIHGRTIVTPAARDLADAHKVLVEPGWPR